MATTFQTIWTAVMNRIRMPVTNTTELVKVKQIVNDVYRDTLLQEDWYWLIKRTVVTTASAYTTGTITVTAGSTAFTLTDAPTSLGTFVGRKVLVSGSTPDGLGAYRIVTHTANAATGLLDTAWANTSTTAAGFHIWQDEYDLPTDFLSLVDFQRYGQQLPAMAIGPRDMLQLKGVSAAEGQPQRYTVLDYETTGDPTTQRQLWVDPYPDKTYRMEVYYRRQATEMGSAEDQPAMPEEHRHVLIDGAVALCYSVMLADDQRGQIWQQRYEQGVTRMAVQHRETTGQKSGWQPRDQYRAFFKSRLRGRAGSAAGQWFDRWGAR